MITGDTDAWNVDDLIEMSNMDIQVHDKNKWMLVKVRECTDSTTVTDTDRFCAARRCAAEIVSFGKQTEGWEQEKKQHIDVMYQYLKVPPSLNSLFVA